MSSHLQVDDPNDYPQGNDRPSTSATGSAGEGRFFVPPDISPLYDRSQAGPTPTSSRCDTPVWDVDGEKRVRFLEPEVSLKK